jgi:hypothetical protein
MEFNTLDFELQTIKTEENSITYEVLRKGLVVGILILDEPYKIRPKKLMTMHNEVKKDEGQLQSV